MYEIHGYQPNQNKSMHQPHSLIGYMYEAYQQSLKVVGYILGASWAKLFYFSSRGFESRRSSFILQNK